jgi:hypothetical protein
MLSADADAKDFLHRRGYCKDSNNVDNMKITTWKKKLTLLDALPKPEQTSYGV